MRQATVRGLAGAVLAAVVLVVGWALPRPLAEPAFVPPEEGEAAAACTAEPCPAIRARWSRLVEAQLHSRASSLGRAGRARLAEAILDEAERARLDPVLVLAMIEVESGWDFDALSYRGARGLMQLRPATLRREAARSGLFGDDPHDPILNVRAGVRYFRRLLDVFRREETALMAYNAGPARIGGYLRSGGIPERFRVYPRRVRAEAARLRQALGEPAGPAVAARDVPVRHR